MGDFGHSEGILKRFSVELEAQYLSLNAPKFEYSNVMSAVKSLASCDVPPWAMNA